MDEEVTNLSRDDELVADAPLLRPFSDELFRRLVLAAARLSVPFATEKFRHSLSIRRVDEVAAALEERVQELETGLLVHGAHTDLVPLVAD